MEFGFYTFTLAAGASANMFKIAFLALHCIRDRGADPASFQHVCISTANLSGRAGLRSAERGDLYSLGPILTSVNVRTYRSRYLLTFLRLESRIT